MGLSIGVLEPFGYWDPLGLMKKNPDEDNYYGAAEWKDEKTFNQYRAAELKHGRLAMLGLTGMIAAVFTRFPVEECRSAVASVRHWHSWNAPRVVPPGSVLLFACVARLG